MEGDAADDALWTYEQIFQSTPRMEGDRRRSDVRWLRRCFNPRPRMGSDGAYTIMGPGLARLKPALPSPGARTTTATATAALLLAKDDRSKARAKAKSKGET
jgi:hypothetical protein